MEQLSEVIHKSRWLDGDKLFQLTKQTEEAQVVSSVGRQKSGNERNSRRKDFI